MGQGLRKKGRLIIYSLLLILFTGLIYQSRFIKAQGNGLSLTIQNSFKMTEYSVLEGLNQSENSITIQLPSASWTIDDIQLNFSDIEHEIDLITIEDNLHNTYKRVHNKNPAQYIFGQAVQIKLDYPTNISGVYIFGKVNGSHPGIPQIQIRGYDITNNNPNTTIYGSTNLNITSTPGWYLQNFSIPISLNKGNYYLVLNGSLLPIYSTILGAGFWWAYNDIDPLNPQLNTSEYDTSNQWSTGSSGAPFLYKLVQKLNLPFYPESNNMTVKININHYNVMNGSSMGDGYLNQTNLDYTPGTNSFTLNIYNNKSENLIFNVSYKIHIRYTLLSTASVSIKENINNNWTVTPAILRHSDNDLVEFHYPMSWENLTIYRDEQDMTSNITIDSIHRIILIPNITIIQGAEWEIKAQSPNILFGLKTPKTEFNLGQELRFSLEDPIIPGNYTFILIDPADTEETRIKKIIPIDDNIFSYELPLTSPDGTYIAYVFWNNATDAGAQSQEFLISIPNSSQPLDLSMLITILIISIVVAGSGISIYVGAKRIVKKRRYDMERLLNKCIDILNLNYLIVTDNKSGLDVYTESYGDKKLDSTLISGFLQAVREFGTHVAEKDTRIVKLDYKDTIILMKEFVNIRLILNMKDTPSEDFIYSVESLAYEIYKRYGDQIEDFKGGLKQFSGIKELIDKHLNVSFLLPFKVVENPNIKLTPSEKAMVNKAIQFVKDHKFDYFYSLYLLPANECTPKDAETILNLIEKGIFKPIK